MSFKYVLCGAVVSALMVPAIVQATEFKPGSVRALGMGGSNIASTHGVDASYWNPAAYGFFGIDDASAKAKAADNNGMVDKNFGLELNVDAGVYLFGPLATNIDAASALPTSVLNATGQFTSQQIQDAGLLVKGLGDLDPAPAGLNALAGGAIGARVSNYGIGVRVAADLNNAVAIDNKNIGLDLFSSFTNGTSLAALPPSSYFSAPQANALVTSLTSGASTMTTGQANAVVAAYDTALSSDARAAGQQQAMADALSTIAAADASGSLTNNATSLSTRGVVLAEVGVTYGYALNENLSVGAVLKYLQADIIAEDIVLLGNKNTDATTFDRNNIETSTGFGLDMGGDVSHSKLAVWIDCA